MSAFREPLAKNLEKVLTEMESTAATTEYVVLDSRMNSEPVFNGTTVPELITALADWEPLGSGDEREVCYGNNGRTSFFGHGLVDAAAAAQQ